MNADGSSLHELRDRPGLRGALVGSGGGGLLLAGVVPGRNEDRVRAVHARRASDEDIYIVNADGSGSVRLTDGEDDQPDWGPPPV